MSALFNACLKENQEVLRTVGTTPPDHHSNGLPYEADGSLCMTLDAPAYYHQGLPFAANGRISASGSQPDRFNSGAMPLAGGSLSTLSGGFPNAHVHGVSYDLSGRLNAGVGGTPAFFYAMVVGDNDGGVLRGYRAPDDPNSPPAFGDINTRFWPFDTLGRFQANTTGGGVVIFGSVDRDTWESAAQLSVDVENYGVLTLDWDPANNDYRVDEPAFGAFLDANLGQVVRWNVTAAGVITQYPFSVTAADLPGNAFGYDGTFGNVSRTQFDTLTLEYIATSDAAGGILAVDMDGAGVTQNSFDNIIINGTQFNTADAFYQSGQKQWLWFGTGITWTDGEVVSCVLNL